MKMHHTTGLAAETPSGPGRGPLRPSNGTEVPPAEPWGAAWDERNFGVPDAELGRAVVIAMDHENDTENYDLLSRYGAIVARAYEAKHLALQRAAVDTVARIYLGTVAA